MAVVPKSQTISYIAIWLAALWLVASLAGCKTPPPEQASIPPRFNVGYQTLDLNDLKDKTNTTLTLAIWYPTAAAPTVYNYAGTNQGNVAPNAQPLTKATPYPLLVFSHGYGGSGLSAIFLAQALAAQGWIVACPDHHDKFSAVRIHTGVQKSFDRIGMYRHAREIAASTPADRGKYRYRLDEMKLALNGVLASPTFGKLVDRDRIAVGGHSFGGYTALGLVGTLPQYYDPRIKAILLFSTGAGGYLYSKEELSRVHIPSMLLMGGAEKDQERGSATIAELSEKIYSSMAPPKYFLEVKGANHFSFNDGFSDSFLTRKLSGTPQQFAEIERYSIAFLEHYVAGRKGYDRILASGDAGLSAFVSEAPAAPQR